MHNKPLLEKRANVNAHTRSSGETSPVRRSVTSNSGTPNFADKKATKVFLSQKQSSSVRDCGKLVPCAPPATPTPGNAFVCVCYIEVRAGSGEGQGGRRTQSRTTARRTDGRADRHSDTQRDGRVSSNPVSYTHLTLPTMRRV